MLLIIIFPPALKTKAFLALIFMDMKRCVTLTEELKIKAQKNNGQYCTMRSFVLLTDRLVYERLLM
jgi:hypothetical protein